MSGRATPGKRGPRTHWARSGEPKIGYTLDEAKRLREHLLDADLEAGHWNTHPSYYECPTCGMYHVGNWHYSSEDTA